MDYTHLSKNYKHFVANKLVYFCKKNMTSALEISSFLKYLKKISKKIYLKI